MIENKLSAYSVAFSFSEHVFFHILNAEYWNRGSGLCVTWINCVNILPPLEARFSTPVYNGPEAHPAFCNNGYRVIPGGKAAGACPNVQYRLKQGIVFSDWKVLSPTVPVVSQRAKLL